MSKDYSIYPCLQQLWPPTGDNRVTNMDVVFFSDHEDESTARPPGMPGETWVQKGHPEVCWPQQWLPEDLGSNVRIFEIRPRYSLRLPGVLDRSVEETALPKLDIFARLSLSCLCLKIEDKDGQGCPLVFVGHGYGSLLLKQALVKLHDQSGLYKDLQSNLCGIVFYGATNTKLTNKHDPMSMENKGWPWRFFKNFQSILVNLMFESDDHLLKLSKGFKAALDLKKVKVFVVNKNKSIVQEIKDYSDLERHFINVMDSDDICTPTSKEDPSYYALLEFLQQFLPKGLHETIDDKKGQEVQLRLSETKDKEALGDMEIASTSTRENRDKEMDEKQCVVQHVVCNVDQDADMFTEEAHKLQAFLCQNIEMDQRHGSSTFPNLHELHSKFLKDTSVFVGARKNVEVNSIEFLFLDAQCMSKVVGVGLHQALVTVTNDNDVRVEALSESAWKSLLASMFMEVQDSGGFELIGFKMPKMEEDNNKTMRLRPAKQVAKQFGVGLKDFEGDHIVTMNKKEESNMFFPVILKVAGVYKALKEGDSHVTKRPSGVGSSSGAAGASASGSSEQGKEEGKSVRNWSLWNASSWWKRGKGDEKDDERKPPGGDPPPDSEPSSEPEMVPCRYTVKVYPGAGQRFHDASEIPSQIKKASMNPKLMIVFFRDQTGDKFLDVSTQTQCNLGRKVDKKPYFGWFQDDIKISFKGRGKECKGADLKDFFASAQKGEEGEFMKEITTITMGQDRSIANLESKGMVAQGMIANSGMRLEAHEGTTNSLGENSSRAEVEEIRGVKQIEGFNVHKRNVEEDLIYKFCIPTITKTSNNPGRLSRYCDTFTPIIVGSWDVSKENASEAANYTFKVKRHLFHIEQGGVISENVHQQDYRLEMFINLAMTHLNGLRSNETIEIRQGNYDGPAIHMFPSW